MFVKTDRALKLLGEHMERGRLNKGWSQRQAAREIGACHATVTRVEQGGNITIAHALALAKAYSLSPDILKDCLEAVEVDVIPESNREVEHVL